MRSTAVIRINPRAAGPPEPASIAPLRRQRIFGKVARLADFAPQQVGALLRPHRPNGPHSRQTTTCWVARSSAQLVDPGSDVSRSPEWREV